jgi:hypothetical protein
MSYTTAQIITLNKIRYVSTPISRILHSYGNEKSVPCLSVSEPETNGLTIHISTPPERVRLERDRNQFLVGRRLVTLKQTSRFLMGRRLVTLKQTSRFLMGRRLVTPNQTNQFPENRRIVTPSSSWVG